MKFTHPPKAKYKFGDVVNDNLIVEVIVKKKYVYYMVTNKGNGYVLDDNYGIGISCEVIREDKL